MNKDNVYASLVSIRDLMDENKNYLVKLDQKFGDGDLGISMSEGFNSLVNNFPENETDIGKIFMILARDLNEAAPSSLGTIISFFIVGIAKNLKGKEEFDLEELIKALRSGANNIKKKANSKKGEKTILDSLEPAIESMESTQKSDLKDYNKVLETAMEVAKEGSENTKNMRAVHGRAAYHNEKTLGSIDGGSFVGFLIFKGIYESIEND
ncbi:MAG: dihydroxyacetone kinase subunit L [Tissierellia bacterium]|nr:dihydroxyacetone kinase subunit L [Tissierellia bacterium]